MMQEYLTAWAILASLYYHLHQVLDPQRGGEPARVCDDVDHCLQDPDGLVHHALGVGAVVRVGQLVAAEVALQEQVHLLVGAGGDHKGVTLMTIIQYLSLTLTL